MFILGHTGLATGVVHAIDRKADLRLVPLVALLPDLIDKPLWLLAPWFANGWTRSAAHSLFAFVVFSILVFWRLQSRSWPLIVAYGSHLVLDRAWFDGQNLLWPFSGFFVFPPFAKSHAELWWEKFSDLWTMGGEALGGLVYVGLVIRFRLWDPERRRQFTTTGSVPA